MVRWSNGHTRLPLNKERTSSFRRILVPHHLWTFNLWGIQDWCWQKFASAESLTRQQAGFVKQEIAMTRARNRGDLWIFHLKSRNLALWSGRRLSFFDHLRSSTSISIITGRLDDTRRLGVSIVVDLIQHEFQVSSNSWCRPSTMRTKLRSTFSA